MKKLILIILLFIPSVVFAYTKDDIVNLTEKVSICDSGTSTKFKTYKVVMTRLLNEKDMTESDINLVYNNLTKALNIASTNNLCSMDDIYSLDTSTKQEVYNLLYGSLDIIKQSKSYNNTKTDISVDTQGITIYNNNSVSDKIVKVDKLNDVGINSTVAYIIYGLTVLLIISIFITVIAKRQIVKVVTTSLIYVCILLIPLTYVFRNYISVGIDALSFIKTNVNTNTKEVIVKDNKIISYPSYGTKYGTIKIGKVTNDLYFGDSSDILKKGVGHYNGSYMMGEGFTIVLSGHNTYLTNLDDTNVDDLISVQTLYGNFKYKVVKKAIVKNTDISILEIKDKEQLVIYTCYPTNNSIYTNDRIVVYADLVSSKFIGEK